MPRGIYRLLKGGYPPVISLTDRHTDRQPHRGRIEPSGPQDQTRYQRRTETTTGPGDWIIERGDDGLDYDGEPGGIAR